MWPKDLQRIKCQSSTGFKIYSIVNLFFREYNKYKEGNNDHHNIIDV